MRVLWPALALLGCGARPPAPVSNRHLPPGPPRVAISLQRTPCFGTCPTYRVTIYGDGRVEWYGDDYVAARGRRSRTVDPIDVAALLDQAEHLRFFERDDSGELPHSPVCTHRGCEYRTLVICSDLSRAVIEIVRDDRRHRVTNEHCQASPLDALELQIDRVARTRPWVGADSD